MKVFIPVVKQKKSIFKKKEVVEEDISEQYKFAVISKDSQQFFNSQCVRHLIPRSLVGSQIAQMIEINERLSYYNAMMDLET